MAGDTYQVLFPWIKLKRVLIALVLILIVLRLFSVLQRTSNSNPGTADPNASQQARRQNVILLTHMRSGSTFVGNLFNLHPHVFYLYEPLLNLRRFSGRFGSEWNRMEREKNDVYSVEFRRLLNDTFSCAFEQPQTLKLLLHSAWLAKPYTAWRFSIKEETPQSLRDVCKQRTMTVAKTMQTRFPGPIGIQELIRLCSSTPREFDCLIVHLVRDPRADLSSLIEKAFFSSGKIRELFLSRPIPEAGLELIEQRALLMCSLVEENLRFVKQMPELFKGRYKLIRYEDVVRNLPEATADLYEFVGLPMVESMKKWLSDGVPPFKTDAMKGVKAQRFQPVEDSHKAINHWREDQDIALISMFEKVCLPMMNTLGYLPTNGSEELLHDLTKPLFI